MSGDLEDEFRRARPPRHDLSPEARARVRSRLDAAMAAEIESSARADAAPVLDHQPEPESATVVTVSVSDVVGSAPPARRRVPMVAALVAVAALLVAFVVARSTDDPEPVAVRGPSATAGPSGEATVPGGVAAPGSESSPEPEEATVHPLVAALVDETVTAGLPADSLDSLATIAPAGDDLDTARSEVGPVVVATVACAWADRWRAATEAGESAVAAEAAGVLDGLDRWPLVTTLGDDGLVQVVETVAASIADAHRAGDPTAVPDHRPQICLDD